MVDEIRIFRLLRAADSAVQSLRLEQSANSDRRADPLWLPGIKYLFICAVGACIDIAQHICSTDASTVPRDNGDAIVTNRLADLGDLDAFIRQVGEWLVRTASPES